MARPAAEAGCKVRRLLPFALCAVAACTPSHPVVVTQPVSHRPHRDAALLPEFTPTTVVPTTAARPVRVSRGTPRTTVEYIRTKTTKPERMSSGDGCGGWRDLVARHFPAAQVPTACRVLLCESGGNAAARNRRSSATGLFQILNGSTDPDTNVAQAAAMARARGWQPWVCK